MKQKILGIDIGSYSVKIALLSRSLRHFELERYYEQTIVQGGRLSREEATASVLKNLVEKNELVADVIAVSLPAHQVSCRVIDLPFTNTKKIEQTIDFELEGHVPLPLEDMLVDYHILSIEENRSTVLAAYLPRSRFVKYLDMLQMAGIDPKYIGIDSIDLTNIAQVAMVPQEAVYALVDVGHEKTNVCIMEGLRPRYVRSISLGGMHFTRAVQKAFRLSLEKAESLKIERGRVAAREEGLDQISRHCQKVAEELVIALRQTYLGFKQIYPSLDWSSLYLTGGGSRMAGIADLLSYALHLNVAPLDPIEFIPHHLEQPDLCRDVIAPSLSQTLRVIFSNRAVKINFRRGEFTYKRDIKALGGEIKQLGAWFGVVIVLGMSHFLLSYYSLNSQIKKADSQVVESALKALPELKGQKKKKAKELVTLIDNKTSEIQSQLSAFKSGPSEARALALLLELSKRMPPKEEVKIDVDDFSFTGDHIRIDGRTVSFEAVDKIKNSLSQSPQFKNVTTQNVVKGLRDEIKFSLSMDVAQAIAEGG